MTLNQKKSLKLISATGGKAVFSADNLSRWGFTSASQIAKALELLLKRDLVAKNKRYSIQDVLFKRWIEKIS